MGNLRSFPFMTGTVLFIGFFSFWPAEGGVAASMEALFRIEMLGRFAIWQGNREITRFRTQKTASLLAYLALNRSRALPRSTLIEQFWPDNTPGTARNNLSVALYALRPQLEPPGIARGEVLITSQTQVHLNPLAFTTDVDAFEDLLQQAQSATEREQRTDFYKSAIELYRGELLPGHYEEWVLTERDRLQEIYRQTLDQVIKAYADARQLEPALVYAHRLVQADLLREESYRQLMRLYAALGRSAEALSYYQELERLLQKELQTTPSSATRSLADQLRQMAPQPRNARKSQSAETSAPGPFLTDTRRPAFKVPLQFTRFYGREEAITQIGEALSVQQERRENGSKVPSASGARLVTLTGPGGTGKTRLSIEVAGHIKPAFAAGIWFVPLAEVSEASLLGESLRDTLELALSPHVSSLEQVLAYLISLESPCLLILDNFEQIVAAGASVVWTLLQRVAWLKCLVTSRQPLSLPGEREIPIAPLPIPNLEEGRPPSSLRTTHLLSYPSVALFVDRAQAARPVFQILPGNARSIAGICAQLEGIPLAIELAAARVKTLTPSQIEARLAERFALLASKKSDKVERHRSLWAAIDWSYHLLAPPLQQFFARLSVFRGGWSLEAAETICEEPLALDYLSQLRAHSLILAEESTEAIRFGMLETIREYGLQRLQESGEEKQWRSRHLEFFLRLAEEAETKLAGAEQVRWLERLQEEHDNLRAALEACKNMHIGAETGLRLAGALTWFWYKRSYLAEGRAYLKEALEREETAAPASERAKAVMGAGYLAQQTGDLEAARGLLEQSLTMYRQLGDRRGMASALYKLGLIAVFQGDYETARSLYEECLALSRVLGDSPGIAFALHGLGQTADRQGDLEAARMLFEQSLGISQELGDQYMIAWSFHSLAIIARLQGDYETSRALLEQSRPHFEEVGHKVGFANYASNLAHVYLLQGRFAEAKTLLTQSQPLFEEVGDKMGIAWVLGNLGIVAEYAKDPALAGSYYAQSLQLGRESGHQWAMAVSLLGLSWVADCQGDGEKARTLLEQGLTVCWMIDAFRRTEDRWVLARSLERLGGLTVEQGQKEGAVQLYGAAASLRETIHSPLATMEQEEMEGNLAGLREALGDQAFTIAWEIGRRMTPEKMAATVLELIRRS